MNRTLASTLFVVAAAVAGQAYAAPDTYEPTAAVSGPARDAQEVRAEAREAAKIHGVIVGADTLVKQNVATSATRDREAVKNEAVHAANRSNTRVLGAPQ